MRLQSVIFLIQWWLANRRIKKEIEEFEKKISAKCSLIANPSINETSDTENAQEGGEDKSKVMGPQVKGKQKALSLS